MTTLVSFLGRKPASGTGRRVDETSTAHGHTDEKLDQVRAALTARELQMKDLEQAHAALNEQTRLLANAVSARESAYNASQEKLPSCSPSSVFPVVLLS